MFLGLRTVIYHAPDLAKAKAWYAAAFNVAPYFDEPFYVGFNVGGYELGLNPEPQDRDSDQWWANCLGANHRLQMKPSTGYFFWWLQPQTRQT